MSDKNTETKNPYKNTFIGNWVGDKYENNSYLFFVITLFLIVTYFFSIGQDPILGDSLAFTVQAYNGFDFTTNATNHFLYSNFLALIHKIIPFINPHYLFVFISIIFSIGTLIGIKKFLDRKSVV